MSYHIIKPKGILSAFVKQYWALDNCLHRNPYAQRVVPSGFCELTFFIKNRPVYHTPKDSVSENTLLCGQQNQPYEVVIEGNVNLISVMFYPATTKLFLQTPITALKNQCIPAREFFRKELSDIEKKLEDNDNLEKRISIIERFLLDQLRKSNAFDLKRISHTISIVNNSKGRIAVTKLANEACLSPKQFERKFAEYVGIPPKQFLRIIRFQHSLLLKQQTPDYTLADLAFDSGYYDQPHMNTEYKSLTGYTPKEYFRTCESFSDYFTT